ncbi:cell adhesion molecule Dscam2-like [Centruroides vittatus]|uniref:cell adhesion molecule Dscam2-like n=1 Tax=Centruroides vittatus TaxID=120091 RepID=UPI00350F3F5F
MAFIFLYASAVFFIFTLSSTSSEELHIPAFQFRDNVMGGEKVTATCTTTTGNGNLVFRWLKDGKEIVEGERIKILYFSDVSNIVIHPVIEEDTGNYTCIVSDGKQRNSFTALLDIKVPPEWKDSPTDTEVIMSKNISVNCAASGRPKPTVLWFKYKDQTRTEIEERKYLVKNGILIIPQATKDDEGYYECEAGNGVGKILKKKILISVLSLYDHFHTGSLR